MAINNSDNLHEQIESIIVGWFKSQGPTNYFDESHLSTIDGEFKLSDLAKTIADKIILEATGQAGSSPARLPRSGEGCVIADATDGDI